VVCLAESREFIVTNGQDFFYKNTRGEQWYLKDDGKGNHYVVYGKSTQTGRYETHIEMDVFLKAGNVRPQHKELRRILSQGLGEGR
jgi:hypothetical protein